MEVKIKKLHPDAVVPFKKYGNDFCYDVVAVSEEEVAPNVWKYGLGIALQIKRPEYTSSIDKEGRIVTISTGHGNSSDLVNLSIDFRPRSSVWKTGMILSNGIGTVDENYTGEIFAVFHHVNTSLERYHVGDKIGQIKLGITLPMNFVEVEELNETDRGSNGYGSTGK